MLYKKSIVLNSIDNSLKKAVINLNSKDGNIDGDVKLYNFIEEPLGVLTIGFLIDGKVHKAGLTRIGYMQYSFKSILKEIPTICTCAVVSSRSGNSEPLLLGSILEKNNLESVLLQNLSVLKSNSVSEVKEQINNSIGEYENQEEVDKEIDRCISEEKNCLGNCSKCAYKKAFYLQESEEDNKIVEPSIERDITKGQLRVPLKDNVNFIDEIGTQIDSLFQNYPRDAILEDIIPNSKWVKIDFNGDGKFYVVGLIYENDIIKYVCYGIPAKWTPNPPIDFNEKAQWLPIDLEEPQGSGYWITYQNAIDGNLVAVNII